MEKISYSPFDLMKFNMVVVVSFIEPRRSRLYVPVPFAHALGVRGFDVLFDDNFPSVTAKPAAEESLDFADLLQVIELHIAAGSDTTLGSSVGSLTAVSLSDANAANGSDAARRSADPSRSSGRARRQPPLLFECAQLMHIFAHYFS